MALTSLTLTGCYVLGDYAYAMSEKYDFTPVKQVKAKAQQPDTKHTDKETKENHPQQQQQPSTGSSRIGQAMSLFRRVPTLTALFMETISFQSLNTILNVAFVQTLKQQIPQDMARAAYSGRFYGLINAVTALFQFLLLPLGMKYIEPAWIWISIPIIPLVFCAMQVYYTEPSLMLVAAAAFLCKTMDYTLRSVVVPLVYQPLDFDSRFLGKEIIGVFGSRFGKSGMSLLLSGLTKFNLIKNVTSLNVMSLVAAMGWFGATVSLSRLIPRKQVAQAVVEERFQNDKKSK
jgi:ATP/ADP translocase